MTDTKSATKVFHLSPIDGRKSFGGKCFVIREGNISKLQSYETIVAEYNHGEGEMKVFGYYSATTMRHINAFFDYYGFNTLSKAELEKKYNL